MSYHYSFSYTWKSVFHSILNLFAEQVRMSVAQRVSTNPVHTVLLHREVLLHKADLRPLLLRSFHVRRPYTTSSRLKGFHHRRRMCPPPLPILFRQGVFRRIPAIAHAILQSPAHLRTASPYSASIVRKNTKVCLRPDHYRSSCVAPSCPSTSLCSRRSWQYHSIILHIANFLTLRWKNRTLPWRP